MSSLTESYLLSNDDKPENSENPENPENPEKNNWYDRVYLCIEKKM
jgi:hypothetical protein